VGTRPNFIKVTQFKRVAENYPDIDVQVVHTGQHYDDKMAQVFFDQFDLRPDLFLNVGADHPAKQISAIITKLSDLFVNDAPDLVIVVGDVNSTLAATIAANKCQIPVAHLESGLRSFDMEMPEEHNRLVADDLANLHFVTEDSGLENLNKEGKNSAGIAFVGNTMIDTLVAFSEQIAQAKVLETLNVEEGNFALVTIHRPSNVDNEEGLKMLIRILQNASAKIPIVFPMHPRTFNKLASFDLDEELDAIENLVVTGPLGYFDFQNLVSNCKFVLTDSGGIQEETTFLKKPCLTLRPNTERPSTVIIGSNVLLPFNLEEISPIIDQVLDGTFKKGAVPPLWDGRATYRIMERIEQFFNTGQ
jgi:UDP-N-acetylglucosamine 2-epimerase (non-hydrolysing)